MGEDFGSWLFLSFHMLLILLSFFYELILQSLLSLHSRLPMYKLWVLTPLWQSLPSRFHFQFWTSLANSFITIYTSHLTSCCQVRSPNLVAVQTLWRWIWLQIPTVDLLQHNSLQTLQPIYQFLNVMDWASYGCSKYVIYLIDSSGQWNHSLHILRASVEIYIIDPLGKTLSTFVKIKQNKYVDNTINITFHTSNYVNSFY